MNRWYTVHNGTVAWKEIWADDDRIATKRVFTDGSPEFMRYFLHKDLQGSTNIVTDDTGLVFQHDEYSPSGEIWVPFNTVTSIARRISTPAATSTSGAT